MGHLATQDRTYQLLQQRLDRNVTGAPESPVFTQILKLLFSPGEADIARQMPTTFISLNRLAGKLEIPPDRLDDQLTAMAERGLVLDVMRNGKRYFTLSPVVIGFFEYTFMRTRDNVPMAELARLFDEYFFQDDRFARDLHRRDAGRALAGAGGSAAWRRPRGDSGLGAGQPYCRDGHGACGLALRAATTTATWARPATNRCAPA